MKRQAVAGALIALGFVGSPDARSGSLPVQLKEEKMVVEYNATSQEASIVVSAEAETGLARAELRGPVGPPLLEMRTDRGPSSLGFLGFIMETGEASRTELLASYPEGIYQLRALTMDGRTAFGSARLSHALPRVPIVSYPSVGDVDVPATNLHVTWVPDPQAVGYHVNLEEGESDLMRVVLSGGTGSFRVPDGILAAGSRYRLEIGAVGPEGNRTIVEVSFMTR